MYNVIPTALSLVFTESLQGCYQIELKERFISDLTKTKPLETCWEPGEDSEILINMLNIHINIPPDIYLLWTYWLEWDGCSCLYTPRLNVGNWLYLRQSHLVFEHWFFVLQNISGCIAMKFCTHKRASKMVYANVLADSLNVPVVSPWGWHLLFRVKYLDNCSYKI